jgi:hypothetical protein
MRQGIRDFKQSLKSLFSDGKIGGRDGGTVKSIVFWNCGRDYGVASHQQHRALDSAE